MKASIAALVISLTSLVSAYPVTGDVVNCRTGPGTSYAIKTSYEKSHDISISCQTTGTSVNGNSIWDKTADYYVKTGSSGYVTKKCSASSGSSSSSYCKTINGAGVDLIAKWEGFVASPKPDPIGLPTVGYGHLCQQKDCAEVRFKFPLTRTTAKEQLLDDLPRYTKCLAESLNGKAKLNDNQWAALSSWVFNRLNNGEAPNTVAAEELPKWRLAGGQVLPGLEARRKDEVKLFKTASSKQAYPKCQAWGIVS
ncbi:family 24 glycoside hydrolase [Trichoderma novae-zelandiae]